MNTFYRESKRGTSVAIMIYVCLKCLDIDGSIVGWLQSLEAVRMNIEGKVTLMTLTGNKEER
jgi:hypothetical protein